MEQLQQQILDWVEQDKNTIVSFFSKLVQCKTPSEPGDTRSAMLLVKDFLNSENLAYQELAANEIMPNLLSSVTMNHEGRHLMFNGHLDVMPAGNEPGWTINPWSGAIADGKVWGRGTSDMKAGVTAMLFAYTYLARLRKQLRGKVSISLVSDEETGYERGTGFLFEHMEKEMIADCVLTGEPSGAKTISFASKGYVQFTVRVSTRGAIAGYVNESKNAILIAADIIRDLKKLETIAVNVPKPISELLTDPQKHRQYERVRGSGEAELLSKTTVDVTTIRGGDLLSVIAPECTFTVAAVVPVGADPYRVVSATRDIISRYPEAELMIEGISVGDISDPADEMVEILQDTVTALGWEKPIPVADIALSDCRHWRYRGIPAFWYGPEGNRCSAADEYVEIEELLHLVRTHALAAVQYLQKPIAQAKRTSMQKTMLAPSIPHIKYIPPIYAACMTEFANSFKQTDIDPVINKLLKQLNLRLANARILAGAAPLAIMEEKTVGKKHRVEITVAFPVGREITHADGFSLREFPGTTAVVMAHHGPGSTSPSWNRLRQFAALQGRQSMEIYREYYIANAPNPAEFWTTELQLPLKS